MERKGRVVIALGGNALKKPKEQGTLEETMFNVDTTTKQIADVLERGYEVVLTHGNGPQVGAIFLQNQIAEKDVSAMPLFICGAESQGMLGYMMQQSLVNELQRRGKRVPVVTLVTQVVVDKEDPAFQNPSKPVGQFYSEEEGKRLIAEGKSVKEDAGRGWRVVVPSPKPLEIVEASSIRRLVEAGYIVVASGGGGIPVIRDGANGGELKGIDAVIDKDLAGERLAEVVEADLFIILTDVDGAYRGYRSENPERIAKVTVAEVKELIASKEFAAGSMLPKMQATMHFVERTGKQAIITSLEKAVDAIDGLAGTRIVA